jgi:hypothetical protein
MGGSFQSVPASHKEDFTAFLERCLGRRKGHNFIMVPVGESMSAKSLTACAKLSDPVRTLAKASTITRPSEDHDTTHQLTVGCGWLAWGR